MFPVTVGLAGHINHGKTTLVRALTGIDTDRLKAEKERGLTIEIGIAPLVLPGGVELSLIDVPGHRKFIKHMLAGTYAIDLAILVIAANEGIKPQTKEHLDILQLLGIKGIIVVLNKIDLIDPEMLPFLQEEIRKLLLPTPYAGAPLVEVSASNGQGLNKLLGVLEEAVVKLGPRKIKEGLARLPVDRIFNIPGFGTVVTGTLCDGKVKVGDYLEIPGKIKAAKIRFLEVHGKRKQEAVVGQRVAINIAGVEWQDIRRGDVLATPGKLCPHKRLDLAVKVLPDSPCSLTDNLRVRFHFGPKEVFGRILVLGQEQKDLYMPVAKVQEGKILLQKWFREKTEITVADFKRLLGVSRRIAVALLEYYDQRRLTGRKGNIRVAGPELFPIVEKDIKQV